MFHIYFLGSNEGILFDVPDAGFDRSLWTPLQQYLTARGAEFRLGTAVQRVDLVDGGRSFRVHDDAGNTDEVDGVVLAADVPGLRDLVDASPDLHAPHWAESVRSLRSAPPFFVQRLWLDAPVAPHRPAFLGTAGREPLDNVSVLDRYDRDAQEWSARRGGSTVELHAYGIPVDGGVGQEACTQRLRRDLLRRLHEAPPGSVFMGGVDVRQIPLATLRGAIGFVAQEPFLFSASVADNIAFGLSDRAHSQAAIEEAE